MVHIQMYRGSSRQQWFRDSLRTKKTSSDFSSIYRQETCSRYPIKCMILPSTCNIWTPQNDQRLRGKVWLDKIKMMKTLFSSIKYICSFIPVKIKWFTKVLSLWDLPTTHFCFNVSQECLMFRVLFDHFIIYWLNRKEILAVQQKNDVVYLLKR